MRVKLPSIILPTAGLSSRSTSTPVYEYDMRPPCRHYGTSYAMVLQSMTREEGLYGYNVNATGRRNASTVFIMLVSGLILYLVYGIGARDLAERLARRDKWRKRWDKMKGPFIRSKASTQQEQPDLIDIEDVAADFAGVMR